MSDISSLMSLIVESGAHGLSLHRKREIDHQRVSILSASSLVDCLPGVEAFLDDQLPYLEFAIVALLADHKEFENLSDQLRDQSSKGPQRRIDKLAIKLLFVRSIVSEQIMGRIALLICDDLERFFWRADFLLEPNGWGCHWVELVRASLD